MTCDICGEEIADFRYAWQKVEGWARPRKKGGVNSISLKHPIQVFRCDPCMIKAKLFGEKVQQEALL